MIVKRRQHAAVDTHVAQQASPSSPAADDGEFTADGEAKAIVSSAHARAVADALK